MPRPPRDRLRELLRTLPHAPSAPKFDAVVAALVSDAVLAPHPLMSLGATLRHRARHLPEEVRDRLRDAVHAALLDHRRSAPSAEPAPPPGGEWLTVREAALALGITEATLHDRLRHPEQRQRLGWPMWDGHRFWIATAAVDPARRAAFLTAQPLQEPLPELLPSACVRQTDGAAVPASGASAPSTAAAESVEGPVRTAP